MWRVCDKVRGNMFSVYLCSNTCAWDESGYEHSFIFMHFFGTKCVNKHKIGFLLPFCMFNLRNYQVDVNWIYVLGFTLKIRVCECCDSSVGIVTRIGAGWRRNRGSIAGRGKKLFCLRRHPNRLWDLHSLLAAGALKRQTDRQTTHRLASKLRMSGSVTLSRHTYSWCRV